MSGQIGEFRIADVFQDFDRLLATWHKAECAAELPAASSSCSAAADAAYAKLMFTGETVILLLSTAHKFGHGFRRCAGEYIARETARLVLQRFEVEIISSDLRKVGLITQRLKRVTCYLRKRTAVSTCSTDSAEVRL